MRELRVERLPEHLISDYERLVVGSPWTSKRELAVLCHHIAMTRAGSVLEIGCNTGETTRSLALMFPDRWIIGLDTSATDIRRSPLQRAERPAVVGKATRGLPNVTIMERDSQSFVFLEVFRDVSLVYVDGDHSCGGFRRDLDNAVDLLRERGGFVLCHDYKPHPDAEAVCVKQTLDELWSASATTFADTALAKIELDGPNIV